MSGVAWPLRVDARPGYLRAWTASPSSSLGFWPSEPIARPVATNSNHLPESVELESTARQRTSERGQEGSGAATRSEIVLGPPAAFGAAIVTGVTYRAIIAHVYTGPDSYASSSRAATSMRLGPFRPSPAHGPVTVTVGKAPRWLFRARRRLHALDLLRGGSLAAWLEGGADPRFRLQRGELSRPWYTTIAMELPPVHLDVVDLDKAMELEPVLYEAAVLVAADSTANVIAKRELRGLFLQRPDGNWVKTPEFELFPPTIGVGHANVLAADMRAATGTLGAWHSSSSDGMRIDWALKALLTDEPWSQFVWLMFSIEELVRAHHRSTRPTDTQPWRQVADAYVRVVNPSERLDWRRPSVTLMFAGLAAHLSPASGAVDTASFHVLKKARDRMLHGAQSEAPDGATRQTARRLVLTYNKLFTMASNRL